VKFILPPGATFTIYIRKPTSFVDVGMLAQALSAILSILILSPLIGMVRWDFQDQLLLLVILTIGDKFLRIFHSAIALVMFVDSILAKELRE